MKRLSVCIAFIFSSVCAFAQTGAVQGFCTQGAVPAVTSGSSSANTLQGVIAGCTVTVYLHGTTTLATIYRDGNNTPLANPFTANLAGATNAGGWLFYAATSQGVDIFGSGGGGNPACTTQPKCYAVSTSIAVAAYPSSGAGCSPNTIANGCTGATTAQGAYANIVAPNLIVSVAQFGADPSLTDNTAALNAAFTYEQANNVCLWFPVGGYKVTSELQWTSSVNPCWRGTGRDNTYIVYTGSSTVDSAVLINANPTFLAPDIENLSFASNANASYALHMSTIGGSANLDNVAFMGGSAYSFKCEACNNQGDMRNLVVNEPTFRPTDANNCVGGMTFDQALEGSTEVPSGQFTLTMPTIMYCTGIGLNIPHGLGIIVNGGQISCNHQQLNTHSLVNQYTGVLLEDCPGAISSQVYDSGSKFSGLIQSYLGAGGVPLPLDIYSFQTTYENSINFNPAVQSSGAYNIFINNGINGTPTDAGNYDCGMSNLILGVQTTAFNSLCVFGAGINLFAASPGIVGIGPNNSTPGSLTLTTQSLNDSVHNYGVAVLPSGSVDVGSAKTFFDNGGSLNDTGSNNSTGLAPGSYFMDDNNGAGFRLLGQGLSTGLVLPMTLGSYTPAYAFDAMISMDNAGLVTVGGATISQAGTVNIPTGQNYEINGVPIGGGGGAFTSFIAGTNVTLTGSGCSGGTCTSGDVTVTASATAATAFSALTSSTNTSAAMLVGSGASLDSTGTGTIDANLANGAVLPASAGFTSTNSSRQLVAAAYTPANCTAGTTGSDCLQLTSGLVPVGNIPTAIPIANIGSAGLSGTAPVSIASTGAISMHVADASDNGYLSSTDWSTFNGKQAALSLIISPNSTLIVGGSPTNTTLDLNLSNVNTWLASQNHTGTTDTWQVASPSNPTIQVHNTGVIASNGVGQTVTLNSSGVVINSGGSNNNFWNTNGGVTALPTSLPPSGTAGGDLSGSYPNPTVQGIENVPFCTGYTPTNGQLVQYTTGGSPNPCYTAATGSGGGTVTSFSAGNLSPLFTTSVATAASTPALTFTLSNAAQNSVLAGPASGGAGAPSYQTAPTISAANMTSFPTLNQNTTGSAAKWTTARNLAGNSVDGSANVAFANKFIVQGTSDSGLSGPQFLGALGTGIVKNTTTTGVLSIAAAADVYGLWSGSCSSSTYLRGDGACATPSGSGTVNSGTASHLAYYASSTTAVSDMGADFTFSTHTLSAASTAIFDMSPATGTAAFKVPSTTTNTASAAGVIDYDTTNSMYHCYTNADCVFGVVPTASIPTTGHVIDASVVSSKFLLHDSGLATANLVTASSPGLGIAHFAGSTQALTSSLIVAADITSATITGTQIASSIALAGSPTTTTQSACDNSTKIATTAYTGIACNTVQTSGSPFTLTAQSQTQWNNTSGAYVWDLPATASGLQVCIGNYKTVAHAISLVPPSGSTIYYKGVAGTTSSATGIVSGGAAGDFICAEAVDTTTWEVIGAGQGTWTNN